MKKLSVLLFAFILIFALTGCTAGEPAADIPETTGDNTVTEPAATPVPETPKAELVADDMTSEDGLYTIAFVTDATPLKDGGFNESIWNGVKLYAAENSLSYKSYSPANGEDASDTDRLDAFQAAVDGGAQVIVTVGDAQADAMRQIAEENPDVVILYIDGTPPTASDGIPLSNVTGISFSEKQLGYLAGYAVVMDGYTRLGLCGDYYDTGRDYGYSFLQGAEDAARILGVSVDVNYTLFYDMETTDFTDFRKTARSWYADGTEVIFICDRSLFSLVDEAAGELGGLLIATDTDHAHVSDNVLFSAVKNLQKAAYWALKSFYAGNFSEPDGSEIRLDAHGDFVSLSTDTWHLTHFTTEEHDLLLADLRDNASLIDSEYPYDIETLNSDFLTVKDQR